jgi:predicted XRE-type DNA-binding protein
VKDKITASSGNVYQDFGFDPARAQVMMLRSEVLATLAKMIRDQGMTQVAAANVFEVS